MKDNVFQLSHGIKSIHQNKLYQQYTQDKRLFVVATFKDLWVFSFHRSSHPEVFAEKGVLKICSKITGEHPCRSVISIKLQSNVAKQSKCKATLSKSVNLLHIFRTLFTKNTSGRLLLFSDSIKKRVV